MKSEGGGAMETLRRKARNCCSKKNLTRKLPILGWLPKYSTDDLLGDAVAGLTVGLTVIPQGIAYAIVAGVPPNYGLYSSFMGAFVYTVFGSCKDITIGPTAIMSILTHEYTFGNAELATLLSFLSGVITFLFGILNLGFLITFVSKPVISGFTSAAAITIASSQIGALSGISLQAEGFVDVWIKFFTNIKQIRWADFALGVSCVIILLFMKKLRDFKKFRRSPDDSGGQKAMKMTVFLISVGRNAIVVIGASILAAALDTNQPFSITGLIEPGLPSFDVPKFSLNNGTESFGEAMSQVGIGIIIIPFISILELIAIGSAFSQGKTLDATQEMIALGLCNLLGSFFHSIPTTGSFSRTAVNASSGVRTTAGGIVTAVLVLLALAVLTPYFEFIPKSALAAVIICAVIFMVEYHDVVPMWKVRRLDQVVLWTTFLISVFWKLEFGIVIGIGVNLCILLAGSASPKVKILPHLEDDTPTPHVVVEARTGLQYVNIDKIRSIITKTALNLAKGIHPIVIDCHHFTVIDYSAARGLEAMLKDFEKREQRVFFINASPGVEKGIKALCPDADVIDASHLGEHLTTHHPRTENGDSFNHEQRRLKTSIDDAIRRLSLSSCEPEIGNPLLEPHGVTGVQIVKS